MRREMTLIYHFFYGGKLFATFKTREGAFTFVLGTKWEEDQAIGNIFRVWKCTNYPHDFYIEEGELMD